MKKKISFLVIICLSIANIMAQQSVQTIRGSITDAVTGSPIPGAVIQVINIEPKITAIASSDGSFELANIPIGRWAVEASSDGYKNSTLPSIMISSGKEMVISIKLEENIAQLKEMVVKSTRPKDKALNDMAIVSARTFSMEETERFAGSLGDPARMVANYAGVMAGNDSRNDIVIRGNSPLGVLWRIEGVEVPNPNHFGAQGTTGGAVSMLNSNLLANSDFLTGAFPAEYGNATSGVFDINMRSGNNSKYEFTGQVGFNGFEAAAEGPISMGKDKQKGSFIADYRYSTLGLISKMGFDLGTGTAIPQYQDFSMLIDLPTQKAGRFKLISIIGNSYIQLGRSFDIKEVTSHSDFGTAINFGANLGFEALTHTYFFNKNTKLKSAVSINTSSSNTIFDTIDYVHKAYFTVYRGELTEHKYSASTQLKHRISNKDNFTTGIALDIFVVNFADSSWMKKYNKRIAIRNIEGKGCSLLKSYAEYQHKFSNSFLINGGVYYQYYDLSNEGSLEPRASTKWQFASHQSLNLGYGLHSQIQPRIISFDQNYNGLTGIYTENNHGLKSTKAQHFVLGYDNSFTKDFRVKVETYYQNLYHVPVSKVKQQYSTLNLGAEYYIESPDSLVNTGKGYNYGAEFTLEKFLSHGYYFLFTASIFDSKYQGYDKVWRNTSFNTNYVFNLLGGYEWKLGKNNFLTFDLKTVWSGGRRETPIDLQASIVKGETVFDDTHAFENKFKDYFRTDFRIGYKINGKKVTQEWALDLQNITNNQNIYSESYNPYTKEIAITYQQSFMPMMLYRINF